MNSDLNLNNEAVEDLFQKVYQEMENAAKKMPVVKLIVLGKTGVGKSTLINSIFREDLAKTGNGTPITKHLTKITGRIPVEIYDTRGLELTESVQKQVKDEVIELIKKSQLSNNEEDFIHAVWYCINSSSNRFENVEINLIKELTKELNIPIIIVLTKSLPTPESEDFLRKIKEFNLNVNCIIPVLAKDYMIAGHTIPSNGLEELICETYKLIPESVKRSFANAQKIDRELKLEQARIYANRYIKSTFLVGASPIPYSDAPILVTQQVAMIAHITSIFGLPLSKTFITAAVTSLLGSGSATLAGRIIVSNMLKIIPGAGTLVGGLISGTTAALLTAALARAYLEVMMTVSKKISRGEEIKYEELLRGLGIRMEKHLRDGRSTV